MLSHRRRCAGNFLDGFTLVSQRRQQERNLALRHLSLHHLVDHPLHLGHRQILSSRELAESRVEHGSSGR